MIAPIIDIKDLAVGYEHKLVLEKANLTVYPNDFIGVIGPNGGGKTTLIKAILGLVPVWKGKVNHYIDKSMIGYLPQFNPFDKAFPISVNEVVLSGLAGKKKLLGRYTTVDFEKADALMTRAGIFHLKNKAIGQLSGGQTQRVLLCRALINDPQLLILDEPSTFVDNNFENELFEWLESLNKQMSIIMVSHDIGTISSQVKTIACINYYLHYHESNKISMEQLESYNCPIQIISHGKIPHQVLLDHK